jgi:hypothetical protein
MARSSDGGMAQGSKHPMGARARAGRSTPGPVVAAKPAVGIRGGRSVHGLRPVGQPPREPADARSTPGARAYLQWAAFVTGTRDEDGGFGAYFLNEPPGGASRYTWTPAADR